MELWRRGLLIVGAIGFASSAYGSFLGQAPSWPPTNGWASLLVAGALATVGYAITLHRRALQLMTASVVLASILRAGGYIVAGSTNGQTSARFAGAGAWTAMAAMTLLVHIGERPRCR